MLPELCDGRIVGADGLTDKRVIAGRTFQGVVHFGKGGNEFRSGSQQHQLGRLQLLSLCPSSAVPMNTYGNTGRNNYTDSRDDGSNQWEVFWVYGGQSLVVLLAVSIMFYAALKQSNRELTTNTNTQPRKAEAVRLGLRVST